MKFVELGLLRVVPFFGRRHRAVLSEDAELGLPHDFGIARDEIVGAALRDFATPWAPPLSPHNFWTWESHFGHRGDNLKIKLRVLQERHFHFLKDTVASQTLTKLAAS